MEFGTRLKRVLVILWLLNATQVTNNRQLSGCHDYRKVIVFLGVEVAHIATILGYRGTVLVYSTQILDMEQIQEMLRSLEVTSKLLYI